MAEVHTIRIAAVPLILLSATVPLHMENFMKATYAAPMMLTVRSNSTARRNLAYAVVSVDGSFKGTMEDPYVISMKERITRKGHQNSPGIIYVPYVNFITKVSELLKDLFTIPCLPYHAGYDKKHVTQQTFMSASSCAVSAGLKKTTPL